VSRVNAFFTLIFPVMMLVLYGIIFENIPGARAWRQGLRRGICADHRELHTGLIA